MLLEQTKKDSIVPEKCACGVGKINLKSAF
jgi:hypothetical protein